MFLRVSEVAWFTTICKWDRDWGGGVLVEWSACPSQGNQPVPVRITKYKEHIQYNMLSKVT